MILLALALAASAPAFDCAKAATNVERMICADEELSALDRAVSRLYSGVRRTDRRNLFQSQADWLKERDSCGDSDCLVAKYDERLSNLFPASQTRTRDYESAPVHGALSILDLGDGWFAFHVVAVWIGPVPGAVNDAIESGHFKLVRGKAEKPATDDTCGWRIERAVGDKWSIEEIPFEKDFGGCGGWNATITGVYSR